MRAALAIALAFLTLVPGLARAQDNLDCENALSTADMNVCAGREFDVADSELNKVYQLALAAIPDMATSDPDFNTASWTEALRSSQRAWIAFRDAECERHVPMFWSGGSGATVEIIGCKTELTRTRTKALRAHYEKE